MAGASISKGSGVFRHFGLAAYSTRTFFYPSTQIYFAKHPPILGVIQAKLVQSLKSVKDSVWSGDGRFDSMGHSAKYGVYTMFCCTIMKIVQILNCNKCVLVVVDRMFPCNSRTIHTLPSNCFAFCRKGLCAFEGLLHLPSKSIAFEGPLPSKSPIAFAIEELLHLQSKCLVIAFEEPLP